MSESTAEQQPAAETSLSEDLEAVYNELATDETEEAPEPQQEAQNEPENEGEQEASESEEGEEAGEEGEGAEPEKLEAPEHWRAEHKEVFEKLDPEGQKFLLDRHKEMEADYTRKRQQDSEMVKQAEQFQPIKDIFQHFPNREPVSTIKQWAGIAYNLEQNPKETLQQLAKQYQVDMAGESDYDDGFVDPEVKSLRDQLQTLQQSMAQQEQQQTQAQQEAVVSKIREFSEAKTEAGEPAHPYFEELYPDMIRLAHAERVAGREPSLEKLYEDAKWINPDIRSKIESAQRKAAEKKAEEAARAKAEKARRAAKTSQSGNGLDSPSDDMGLREMLESQIN